MRSRSSHKASASFIASSFVCHPSKDSCWFRRSNRDRLNLQMSNPLLDRYIAGEYRQVWRDLVDLGAAVRHELYYQDATEVTAETMRRARHNVESIIRKLDELGYQFSSGVEERLDVDRHLAIAQKALQEHNERLASEPRNAREAAMAQMLERVKLMQQQMSVRAPQIGELKSRLAQRRRRFQNRSLENPDVFSPPNGKTSPELNRFEKALRGPLPLSLRSWFELVGPVNLMGRHEVLNPQDGDRAPDPLVIYPFKESAESDFGEDLEFEGETIELALSPDDLTKSNISGGGPYAMTVPDPAADALFLNESRNTTFVEYLRRSFAWGGFPGWESSEARPQKEIDFLCEGLLPL